MDRCVFTRMIFSNFIYYLCQRKMAFYMKLCFTAVCLRFGQLLKFIHVLVANIRLKPKTQISMNKSAEVSFYFVSPSNTVCWFYCILVTKEMQSV